MNLQELKSIVKNGESNTTEFKTSTANLRAACSTVCAFLNGQQGGNVFIGVKDHGLIVGQDISDQTKKELVHELNKIEPSAQDYLDIIYVTVGELKEVIAIQVKAGRHVPYVYDGRPYQRDASNTNRMSQHRYEQLLTGRRQINHAWESLLSNHGVENIDEETLLNAIQNGIEKKQMPATASRERMEGILQKFKLMNEGKLLNGAIVLFGKEFFPEFPQCQLKMARFKGINKKEFLDSNIIYGNIFEILKQGELFIKKHLPLAARIIPGQLKREETPIIPYNATREALVNAISHRDYSNRGGAISLAIYDDRLEIFNTGGLIEGLTLEIVKEGRSEQRNPLIGEILYRTGYIEKWGRGIQEMISTCIDAEAPEPEFVASKAEFKVIFRFLKNLKPNIIETLKEEKIFSELTPRQKEIIKILSTADEFKLKDILQLLKSPPAERTLREDLSALKHMQIVGSKGRARTAVWFLFKKS